MELAALLPEGVSFELAIIFMIVSFFASGITVIIGLGGGLAMLVVLGLAFPPTIAIPIHAVIQLGSNTGRLVLLYKNIQWHMVIWFCLGSAIGAVIGAKFAFGVPETLLSFIIGIFIIYSVWFTQPKISHQGKYTSFFVGIFITAISMVIGAVGTLIGNYLRVLPERKQIVSTQAMLAAFNNAAKITAFSLFGFAFSDYLPLCIAIIFFGFFGTMVGAKLLEKIPEQQFRLIYRIVLTLLAVEMLRQGFSKIL